MTKKKNTGTTPGKNQVKYQVPCSEEFSEDIHKRFQIKKITPGMTHDEIMFQAGQASILEYISKVAVGKSYLLGGKRVKISQ